MHYDGMAWSPMSSGTSAHLRSVWGTSASDVFAVGDNGTILRYDGTAWSALSSGTAACLYDVWGTSSSDFFAVGGSGPSPADLAWGSDGTILHYDGVSWSVMTSGPGMQFKSVWGRSASDVYVAGCAMETHPALANPNLNYSYNAGRIWRYDGTTWSEYTTLSGKSRFDCLWAAPGSKVFAGGIRFRGSFSETGWSWSSPYYAFMGPSLPQELYPFEDINGFNGIWGSSSDDMYVVCGNGTILHWHGTAWSIMDSDTGGSLCDIWGSSPSDVFAVGESGTIVHLQYEPPQVDSITPEEAALGQQCVGITIKGKDLGEAIEVSFGEGVSVDGSITYGATDITCRIAIAADAVAGPRDVSISTPGGPAVLEGAFTVATAPRGWRPMVNDTTTWLVGLSGSSASDVLACGSVVLHWDGTTWSPIPSIPEELSDAWYRSSADAFAISIGGAILHFNGEAWTYMAREGEGTLNAIWGCTTPTVFAVGGAGTILRYDGSTCGSMSSGTGSTLRAVWGTSSSDVFAVGDDATILHCDGETWSSMSTAAQLPFGIIRLNGVWGSSESDVYAVGSARGKPSEVNRGIVLHYDGSTWNLMDTGAVSGLNAIWGTSASDVFAVGDAGTILHYDGKGWSRMVGGICVDLNDVWGHSGTVYTVGGQSLLRYEYTPPNQRTLGPPMWIWVIVGVVAVILAPLLATVCWLTLRRRRHGETPLSPGE